MKNINLLCLLFISSVSFAQTFEHEARALIRSKRDRAVEANVFLRDLESSEAFDGKYFKIVKGKSNDAIRFDAESKLTFKAATVYHHLTKARDYFAVKINSEYVKQLPKMVIRIDHSNQFSELGHFANDNLEPQFNNALTIPAGKGFERRGIKPWGLEIWFRPSKKIHLSEISSSNQSELEYLGLLANFRNNIHMQTLQRFFANAVMAFSGQGSANIFALDSVVRTAGASVLLEGTYRFYQPLTKIFQRRWYWLETALVPEIIYHEYAHAALSDYLQLTHSTAIIEGMADFFAGQIGASPSLAEHIKKYNTYNGKNATKKQSYMIQFETTDYANTDFVFGLLWEVKKILGEEKGEQFMFELRKKLTTNSTIRGQLIEGLLQNCEENCASRFNDRLKILKALNARGI
jgi:hypothetical protein